MILGLAYISGRLEHSVSFTYLILDWSPKNIRSSLGLRRTYLEKACMDPRRYEVLFNFADDSWAEIFSGTKVQCVNYLAEEMAGKRRSGHSQEYCLKHRGLFTIQVWKEDRLFGEGLYGVP